MYGVFNVAPLRESAAKRQSTDDFRTLTLNSRLPGFEFYFHFQALPLTLLEVIIQTRIIRKIRDSTPRGIMRYYYIWVTLVVICNAHAEVPGIQHFVIIGYFFFVMVVIIMVSQQITKNFFVSLDLKSYWIFGIHEVESVWFTISMKTLDVDEVKEDNQSSLIYFQWVTSTVGFITT